MVDVEATIDAQPATEQGIPGVAGEVPGSRKRRRSAEAADEENATSSVVCGSELLTSESEHCGTIDDNTFPILCILEKDARGVYTVSGLCRLCDRTFRATGAVTNGKVLPWNKHARVHHQIEQHARKHGAVGYLPHRNLDEMRLDWARSPGEAAEVVADASASRVRRKNCCCSKSCKKCGVYQALSAFRCTKSRERVDICGSCELVPCAACAAMLPRGNFAAWDIRRYFNFDAKHITCLVCKEQQQHAGRQQRLQERKEKSKRKARTCTKCGVHQTISAFRLTKKNGRVDICGNCELVSCAACAATLSRASFAAWDIRRYFSFAGARHITCLVCKAQQQHARQQRLQELMKKSKRKVCTCKQPQAQTRTCLLHGRFA